MVQIKTCSDFPTIKQISSGDICGPEWTGDKFIKERGFVHQQKEVETKLRFRRDNVMLK